jgi:hypothetical protein
MVWSPAQLSTPPPPPQATHCLHRMYFDFGRWGGEQDKVGWVIVHKAGSKIPT